MEVTEPLRRRWYQDEAVRAVLDARARGKRSVLVVMATGAGKSLTFADLTREFGVGAGPVVGVMVAHDENLLRQAYDMYRQQIPTAKMGFEKGSRHAAARSDIVIGSIQSLREQRLEDVVNRFSYRLGIVVIDEAHRSAARSYRDLLAYVLRETDAMIVGFTATPDRTDGVGMTDLYEEVVYVFDTPAAIADGWLVEPQAFCIESDVSVDSVSSRNGDFVTSKLAPVVNIEERNRRVVYGYREFADGKQAIVLCAGIRHTEALAEQLRDAGIPSEAIHGEMAPGHRRNLLKRYDAGDVRALCGANLLVEGVDLTGIEAVVWARPTESGTVYRQGNGRGFRPHKSIARILGTLQTSQDRLSLIAGSCKPRCIVIDVVDVTTKKSLKTMPSTFGVPYKEKVSAKQSAPRKVLPVEIEVGEPPDDVRARVEAAASATNVPLRWRAVNVLEVEEILTAAMGAAKFSWTTPRSGVRRIHLPKQPVLFGDGGHRVEKFAATYKRARAVCPTDAIERALAECGGGEIRYVPVSAQLWRDASGWRLAIYESEESVYEGVEPTLPPAVRRVEAMLRARYPGVVAELITHVSWRSLPPNTRQVQDLEQLGLPLPSTRGEAYDLLKGRSSEEAS